MPTYILCTTTNNINVREGRNFMRLESLDRTPLDNFSYSFRNAFCKFSVSRIQNDERYNSLRPAIMPARKRPLITSHSRIAPTTGDRHPVPAQYRGGVARIMTDEGDVIKRESGVVSSLLSLALPW